MKEVIGLLSLRRFKEIYGIIFIMPHTMRLLNSLIRNSLSKPKKKCIKKIKLSENCFDSVHEYSSCRLLKPGQSHQDYMLEYYKKKGVGDK